MRMLLGIQGMIQKLLGGQEATAGTACLSDAGLLGARREEEQWLMSQHTDWQRSNFRKILWPPE